MSRQEKGATRKRACNTHEDLESYHQLRNKLLSNDEGKRDIQYSEYARASSEGPGGFRKVIVVADDGCASPGIGRTTMANTLVGANSQCHDKGATRNHISEVDETGTEKFSLLRGLDDSIIATENLEKDSLHKRGTANKPDNDQNLKRHINEIDEFDKKKEEISASTSENARDQEPFCENQIPTKGKQIRGWGGRYNTNSIISTSPLPLPPASYKSGSVMGKVVVAGAPQPKNTLHRKKSATPTKIIDLHSGYSEFEGSYKRRRTNNPASANGSSGRPIDLEQDAESDRPTVEELSTGANSYTNYGADSDLHLGTFSAESRSFVHDINSQVPALPSKTRNARRKIQKTINSSSGGQSHQFTMSAQAFPEQRENSRRLHGSNNSHNREGDDSIEVDELNDSTIEVLIPCIGTGSKRPRLQAPTFSTSGYQTSPHFSKHHASQISSRSGGARKRQPLAEMGLSSDEDELSQADPLAAKVQNPARRFGRKQEFHDGSSLETRGDIAQTDFGNRGTGGKKKRQNDEVKSTEDYKVVSMFSENQYWVRPEDPNNSILRQDLSTGDLSLINNNDAIEGSTIKLKSINKVTRAQESNKVIIEKSRDKSILQGPKIYLELNTEQATWNLGDVLTNAMAKTATPATQVTILETSQIDKIFAHVRRELEKHLEAQSTKRQIELPDDVQLMQSNQERRGRSRKFDDDDDTGLQRVSKRAKLRDAMKSDPNVARPVEDDDVQVQETSAAITPTNFYGREVTGKTRASLRSADRSRVPREPPRPRSPSPDRWTHTHPDWDKNWLKSIIYPAAGKKTATVDKQDIERLDEGEFLNDNLIMFYLYWLEQQHPHLADRVYVHNTFFYASLTNTAKGRRGINYEAVQRWTAKVDLPSYDYIIVPVNEHTHWYVAIICNASRLLESEAKSPTQSLEKETTTDIKEHEVDTNEHSLNSPYSKPSAVLTDAKDVGVGIGELSLQEHGSTAEMDEQEIKESPRIDTPLRNYGLPAELPEVEPRNGTDASAVLPANTTRPQSLAGDLKTPVMKGRKKTLPPRIYDPKEPRIITFDSLGIAHSVTCRNLKDYIAAEIKTRLGVSIMPPKPLGMAAKNIATQNNYCDCGVFLLGYMEEFFARPDAFIEDIMQNKYDNDAYITDPRKLRCKIRDIIFGLQKEEVQKAQEAQEARKAKQVKLKSKNEPRQDNAMIEPSASHSASIILPKSTRTSPAAEPHRANTENSLKSSAPPVVSLSPASQTHKCLPEVINLDDSQDHVEHKDSGSLSTPVKHSTSLPNETPLPKQHLSSIATSTAAAATKNHHTSITARLEIPDSQEESAAGSHDVESHTNNTLNSQVLSLDTNTTDQNQKTTINTASDVMETGLPPTSKGILSGLNRFARGLNPWGPKRVTGSVAPEEEPDRSPSQDKRQSSAIPLEKADARSGIRASQSPNVSSLDTGRSGPRDLLRQASEPRSSIPLFDDVNYLREPTSNGDDEIEVVLEAKALPRRGASAKPVDLTRDEPDEMLLDRHFNDISFLTNSSSASAKSNQPHAGSETASASYKRKAAQRERNHDQVSVDLTSPPRKENSWRDIPNHRGYPRNEKFISRDSAEDAMISKQRQ
ncbi:hypothetical protein ACMFMF_001662 [Clarireedia jacksonii]